MYVKQLDLMKYFIAGATARTVILWVFWLYNQ